MADKKEAEKKFKSIKVSEEIWELVKANKKETYLPIGVFFEIAAREKLKIKKSKING